MEGQRQRMGMGRERIRQRTDDFVAKEQVILTLDVRREAFWKVNCLPLLDECTSRGRGLTRAQD